MLPLGLMEEFRPFLADGVAAAAITRGVIQAEDLREAEDIMMWESAIERFVAFLDRRLRSELTQPAMRQQNTYWRAVIIEARVFAKAMLGEPSGYLGCALERWQRFAH